MRLRREATFRARQLRAAATPAERHLWQQLRGRRLDGAKFRRQQPLGPYIADFFCEDAALVVLRFENEAILLETSRVLAHIRAALRARHVANLR
jgi:very-short-patch-repair endonuclease